MIFRVTPRAHADLEAIAEWTAANWGSDQMATYLRALTARFSWLADAPDRGRDRTDIGEGYRSFPEGRHVIFFICQQDTIAIIGVPHQAMDVLRHFAP